MQTDLRDTDEFSRELRSLKRRGCNLLVVTDATGGGGACERLLGEADVGRRRLFIPTTAALETVLARHYPLPKEDELLGVVDAGTSVRSPPSRSAEGETSFESTSNASWYTRVDEIEDIEELECCTRSHLARFGTAKTLDRGEVRLCIESLDPFIEKLDFGSLYEFLEWVTDAVRTVHGIGHYHVSSTERDAITYCEALFDATLHVTSTADGVIKQRWLLHESGHETEWLPLYG